MKEDINLSMKLSGEYQILIYDDFGNIKTDTGYFPNLITDAFFDNYIGGSLTPSQAFSFCGVGSGTATPAVNDSSITQIGVRAGRFSEAASTSGSMVLRTCQFRFAQNAIIGTIAEIGIFNASTAGTLYSRSLIKDAGGTPTTLTLITGDTLYINWRASVTIPADQSGTISISGTSYNYLIRPSNWTATGSPSIFDPLSATSAAGGFSISTCIARATQTLGSITSAPSGTGYDTATFSVGSYVTGVFERTITYTFAIAQGNTGSGIGSLQFARSNSASFPGFQMSLAQTSGGATLPKTESLVYVQPIKLTWSR